MGSLGEISYFLLLSCKVNTYSFFFFLSRLCFAANKRLVYEAVKRAVERDRSTVKVSELSNHGLMEITRKRVCPATVYGYLL
jgi:hypothetical protein